MISDFVNFDACLTKNLTFSFLSEKKMVEEKEGKG